MTTTTKAPAATEVTTPPQAAIVPADNDAVAISRWEAIANDIAIAGQTAPTKTFDYHDKSDNKRARSWVHELRQLKGRIERARKDAKAVHLQRGKAVDETAKSLEAAVQGLIEPHETAIKAIEAEEQARVDAHRAVLDRIAALAEEITTAAEAEARLAELLAIDTSGLEEFAQAGVNRQAKAIERLEFLRDTLAAQEAERIELEALRAEKAAREEAERIERIRQEAVEADRLAREAQALAQVEAARLAQQEAERLAEEAAAREEARIRQQAEMEAERREAAARAEEARQQRRAAFVAALTKTLAAMDPGAAAAAIADGQLHPAVRVDWSQV